MSLLELNIKEFKRFKNSTDEGPIVMLNLLKFKPDGGEQAYARYAATTGKMVLDVGGRVIYSGRAMELLTGEERWDAVLIVEYPSRKDFLRMIARADYQAAHADREAGLEKAVLYTTRPADLRKLNDRL